MRYPWDLAGPLLRAIAVQPSWDDVIVTMRAVPGQPARTLRVPYDYAEATASATPLERMLVELSPGGLSLEWRGLGYGVTIDQVVQDADAGTSQWEEPPAWVE